MYGFIRQSARHLAAFKIKGGQIYGSVAPFVGVSAGRCGS